MDEEREERQTRKKKRLALKGYSTTDPWWLRGYSHDADLETLSFREANAYKKEVDKALFTLKHRGPPKPTPRKMFDLRSRSRDNKSLNTEER